MWKLPEQEIIPTLEKLGIGLVPYSPLGKGYLTGTITERTRFNPNDNRCTFPRFSPGPLKANRTLGREQTPIPVVYGPLKVLFATEISLGREDRRVSQQ